MAEEKLDDFYYARDHDRGPGAWCVRGKNDFYIPVPDKMIAYAIGKFMSGETDDALKMLADWSSSMNDGWRPTNWPPK